MLRALVFLLVGIPAVFAATACVQQQCSPKVAEADIVFLLDTSESLGEANFNKVKTFLFQIAADFTIGAGTDQTQVAFITYSQSAQTYGDLGKTAAAVNSTITSLSYDGYGFRDISSALNSAKTVIKSLRSGAKKLLVAVIADTFTGTNPSDNGVLDQFKQDYDAVLTLGIGLKAIQYAYDDVTRFSTNAYDAFFINEAEHLDFARLWIERNACPAYHAPTVPPTTTVVPTQPSSVSCTVNTLEYDIYLVIDASTGLSYADFNTLKSNIISFIQVFGVNSGATQFGVVSVAADPQRYYTGFHAGQTMGQVLSTVKLMAQEESSQQALNLALVVSDMAYMANYAAAGGSKKQQLLIYFTGNTNFDVDPTDEITSLKTKYNLNVLTVRYATAADADKLAKLSGGASCVIDATDAAKRSQLAATLEQFTCSKNFC
uniref:VWFA domain-containing protein n=1 Tax=Panagrellus redivivus TaxID=6233 RepID=A0A7E4ZUC5_PANRE